MKLANLGGGGWPCFLGAILVVVLLDDWIREGEEAREARGTRRHIMERRDPVEFFSNEDFFQLFRLVIAFPVRQKSQNLMRASLSEFGVDISNLVPNICVLIVIYEVFDISY